MNKQEFMKALILSVSRQANTKDSKKIAEIIKENGEMVKKAIKMIAASSL
jgi:hypothetical protein